MLPHEILLEAQQPAIGRKYQHLEDLVYTNGAQGALHAIERLKRLPTDYATVEVKWDGSPVYYWGRDNEGKFYFFPKNAWQYYSQGKQKTQSGIPTTMDSPQAVQKFIAGTGRADTPEQQQERAAFSRNVANLYQIFEAATPSSFRGFVEGGLLWAPFMPFKRVVGKQGVEYQFQPNVTTFYVRANSGLGQKIQDSKAGVAVTGYYPEFGSDEERLDPLKLKSLNIDPDLVVQGPIFIESSPKLDTEVINALGELERDVVANKDKINGYLAAKPGLKSPGSKIYEFMGSQRSSKFANLVKAFPQWVKSNTSSRQQEYLLDSNEDWRTVISAVAQIMSAKDNIIDQWLNAIQKHSVIRQENPEGFAQPHQGGYAYDIPGQFVKYIKRSEWQPR